MSAARNGSLDPPATGTAIEVVGLVYANADGTPPLDGVSLRIAPGESVAVVGANGAGKSTLLVLLTGLLEPVAGGIRMNGLPLGPGSRAEIRRSLGMVFQEADDQLFMPTAAEDVAFGPQNLGLPADVVQQRVNLALEQVGALALGDRSPHRLSGGHPRPRSGPGPLFTDRGAERRPRRGRRAQRPDPCRHGPAGAQRPGSPPEPAGPQALPSGLSPAPAVGPTIGERIGWGESRWLCLARQVLAPGRETTRKDGAGVLPHSVAVPQL